MGDLKSYLNSLKTKRVAVVGAGISNTPLIKLLLDAGIDTTICDKSTIDDIGDENIRSYKENGAKLKLGEDYLENLSQDIIFRTPGLMPSNPFLSKAAENGATLTSEMEVFFELCPCKIIAVTGSDGKTTTTSIIAELLRNEGKTVHVGGNIGTPLLGRVDEIKNTDIAVIELSSFQLITMKKSPGTAVVTNLSPNHLDVHTDLHEYVDAKSNIFIHQRKADRAVFNFDNTVTNHYSKIAPAGDVKLFSRFNKVKNGTYLRNGIIYESKNNEATEIMHSDEIVLPGTHNIENYLAAISAVSGIVGQSAIKKTANSFYGVEHRIEFVRELTGVRYYNDSIASSPSRAIAGLKAFSEREGNYVPGNKRKIILIAGGKDKGIEFDELGIEINARVKTLILTGTAAEQIRRAVNDAPNRNIADNMEEFHQPQIHHDPDFTKAVEMAAKEAQPGDIVLLSPACTSFDSFKNFEERGNKFKEIIDRLV
ncbi:MAG: UDP-N-acetylmuramoyl-L-alanine--D-glutamate ligase [Oscillospiraceae bacterium]|nr:UDP-N-acetylmuramoyl-L-alanine--D-glutamate ligase [Oscillospiraceae bacterium]